MVTHAAAPARAVFATAQADLVIRTNSGSHEAASFSLTAGDSFHTENISGVTRVGWAHPGSDDPWNLDLSGPAGAQLVQGTYERAMSGSQAEWFRPGLALSGRTACQGGNSRFVINQIEFAGGVVSKLDLYFEQDCGSTRTFGRVVLGVPLPGAAAAGGPAVLFAASASYNPAAMRVFARIPAGVESMIARVISTETGLEVARSSAFSRQFGTDSVGIWTGLPLPRIGAPGFYRIDVDIVDRGGAQVSQSNVGYVAHAARAEFTFPGLEPRYVDFHNRTTKVTGFLTSRQPGTNQILPIAGANLSVITQSHLCACADHRVSKVVGTGATGPDGSFSIFISIDRFETVSVVYQGNPSAFITGNESSQIGVEFRRTATNMIGPPAFWGPTATISGMLTYWGGLRSQDVPVPDAEVQLQDCDVNGGCSPVASTRTDAQGRYSLTHTRTSTEGSLKLVAKPTDPFLAEGTWQMDYATYDPSVRIEGFAGLWLTEFRAQFAGQITFTGDAAAKRPIAIQVQTGSGWQTVRVAPAYEHNQEWFFVTDWAPPCGSSLWRATYGPNNEVVSNLLQADRGCMGPTRPQTGGDGGTLPPQR